MPGDDKLTHASPRNVEPAVALALTSGRSFERAQAAEVTAKVVAERLVAHLERSGFVIMRRPIAACVAPEADRRGIINELIYLFDGPAQREAERLTREALADGEKWQYQ
jgi:hypothetical protein